MIFIFKGDSMDSRFGREITFSLDIPSQIDTTGCSVEFRINGVVASAEISEHSATISLTSDQTNALDYGVGYASVALVAGSHRRTIANDIIVIVTDDVAEVDGSANTIGISIKGGFEEALNGVNWDAGGSIASLRDFLARVGTAMGATITAR